HAVPISEYVIGAMLAFAKGLPRALRSQQERIWRPYWPDELEEKTVGVLGMGAIGARVVELAKALGMRVLAMRRSVERRTTGAPLDVFQQEPLSGESELWGLENVIVTPHISGGTPRYMERAVALFCDNLRRYLADEPLRNVVDPARGY